MLRLPRRQLLAIGLAVALGALGLAAVLRGPEHSDKPFAAGDVARLLKRQAHRQRIPVYRVHCVRAGHRPRSFDCFTEGADDLHLAYRVTVDPDGRLIVRPPEK